MHDGKKGSKTREHLGSFSKTNSGFQECTKGGIGSPSLSLKEYFQQVELERSLLFTIGTHTSHAIKAVNLQKCQLTKAYSK